MPTSLEIGGYQVHAGSTVQLKWLGVWYEGFVVKIGPKKNLYRVRDAKSHEIVLMESKQLQLRREAQDKRMSTGAQVVYSDGDCQRKGVVESRSAVGDVLVSWRKSGLSGENRTWFELSHISPVIHSQLHNQERLEAVKSGLMHNDAIEPRPRSMSNLLYESGSDTETTDKHTKLAASKKYLARKCYRHSEEQGVAEKEKRPLKSASFHSSPLPSYPPPPAPMYTPFHPMIPHPHIMPLPPPPIIPYPNFYFPPHPYMTPSTSYTSMPNSQKMSSAAHPRSLKKLGGLSTSSDRPTITTYTSTVNGIPPLPSSEFLQSLRDENKKSDRHVNPWAIFKSRRLGSRANSERTHHTTVTKPTSKPESSRGKESPEKPMPQSTSFYSAASSPASRLLQRKGRGSMGKKEEHDVSQGVPSPLPSRSLPPRLRSDTDSRHKHSQSTRGRGPSSEKGKVGSGSRDTSVGRRSSVERDQVTDDEDEYTSVFTDNDETQVNEEKSDVAVLKVVSASPAYETVSHGGSAILTCVAQSHHPVHYQWLSDGKPISEHDPFFTQPAPGMLQVQMASLYLTGEYRCVVSDGISSIERVFHLEVLSETLVSGTPNTEKVETHIGKVPPEYEAAIDTNKARANSPQPAVPLQPESSAHQATSLPYTSPAAEPPQQNPSFGRDMTDITGKDPNEAGKEAEESVVSKEKGGVVSGSRRSQRKPRWRVSAALKNDMEQYLKGYGENYGEISPQPDVSTEDVSGGKGEGWWRKKRSKDKMKKKKAKSLSHESSSPTKSTGSLKNTDLMKRNKSLGKLSSSLLGKIKKKPGVAGTEKMSTLTPGWTNKTIQHNPTRDQLEETASKTEAARHKDEESSVAMNSSEASSAEEKESPSASIHRLQLSFQTH